MTKIINTSKHEFEKKDRKVKVLNPDIRKQVVAVRSHLYGLRLINYRAI